jgi:hypothetical protein
MNTTISSKIIKLFYEKKRRERREERRDKIAPS